MVTPLNFLCLYYTDQQKLRKDIHLSYNYNVVYGFKFIKNAKSKNLQQISLKNGFLNFL